MQFFYKRSEQYIERFRVAGGGGRAYTKGDTGKPRNHVAARRGSRSACPFENGWRLGDPVEGSDIGWFAAAMGPQPRTDPCLPFGTRQRRAEPAEPVTDGLERPAPVRPLVDAGTALGDATKMRRPDRSTRRPCRLGSG